MVHRRISLAGAAIVAAAALWTAEAPAAAPAARDVVSAAKRTASAQWPGSECRGRENVVWVPQAVLNADHLVKGLAGDALPGTCTVRVVAGARDWTGPRLCALLQHEFGHLAGRSHSEDPADVMFGGTIPWTTACTRAFRPPRARSKDWKCRIARAAAMTMAWKCRPRRR